MKIETPPLRSIFTFDNIFKASVIIFCLMSLARGCKGDYDKYLAPDPVIENQKDSIKQKINTRQISEATREAEELQLKKDLTANQNKLKDREKEIIKTVPDNTRIDKHKQFLRDLARSIGK